VPICDVRSAPDHFCGPLDSSHKCDDAGPCGMKIKLGVSTLVAMYTLTFLTGCPPTAVVYPPLGPTEPPFCSADTTPVTVTITRDPDMPTDDPGRIVEIGWMGVRAFCYQDEIEHVSCFSSSLNARDVVQVAGVTDPWIDGSPSPGGARPGRTFGISVSQDRYRSFTVTYSGQTEGNWCMTRGYALFRVGNEAAQRVEIPSFTLRHRAGSIVPFTLFWRRNADGTFSIRRGPELMDGCVNRVPPLPEPCPHPR